MRNEWDLPRLEAWTDYCQENPTVRAMVHAYLGIKSKAPASPDASGPDILEMLAMFPGAEKL